MTKITISLTDEEDIILCMYKRLHKLGSKEKAIKEMIVQFRGEVKKLNIK